MTVERGGGELRAEEEENCGLIFFYIYVSFPAKLLPRG